MRHRYLIALGSNVRHHRHGRPEAVLRAALALMEGGGIRLEQASPVIASLPVGPSLRCYANGAAIVCSGHAPPALLARLKALEQSFGRRRTRRWGARVLDLDIVLWSGGVWREKGLTIPHAAFRQRGFVLEPASRLAPRWRDPETGLSLRQLNARLRRHARRAISPPANLA